MAVTLEVSQKRMLPYVAKATELFVTHWYAAQLILASVKTVELVGLLVGLRLGFLDGFFVNLES